MNILQTALDTIELLTTDNTSEQAQAAAAGARIKLANAMAVEPVLYQRRMKPNWGHQWTAWDDCSEATFKNVLTVPALHDWTHQARALYLHPAPQQVAVPSGERAELIAAHQELNTNNYTHDDVEALNHWSIRAHDMLEADAQPPAPTGWDNGLSQDYCKELGQWLASRPGARQQVKEMFGAAPQQDNQDKARLDWLEQNLFNRENLTLQNKVCKTHWMWVMFAPRGVQGDARKIIDAAMAKEKP